MPEQTGSKLTGGSTTGTRPPLGRHPIRAAGHVQLTDRDIEILMWVTRHGVVTLEQIARRFFPTRQGLSAATQRVRKLCTMTPPLLQLSPPVEY
jgi:DNA-binding CsgD family transcriptional regulator